MTRRLTQEQVWIARLFQAACADENAIDRHAGRSGLHTDVESRISSADVEQRTEAAMGQRSRRNPASLERARLAVRT